MGNFGKLLLSFIIPIFYLSAFSQNDQTLDSLKTILSNAIGEKKATVQNELATAYLNIDNNKAIYYCIEAKNTAIRAVSDIEEARSYFILGRIYVSEQEYTKATSNFNTAKVKFKAIKDYENYANAINETGKIQLRQSEYTKAIISFLEARQIRSSNNLLKDAIYSNINIGIVYKELSKFDSAMYYLNIAKETATSNNDSIALADVSNNIAGLYWKFNQYDKALSEYETALNIWKKYERRLSIAKTLNNIGIVYKDLSNFEKALNYHLRALEIKKELNNLEDIAYSLNNIGSVYWKLNDYDNALAYYTEALSIRLQSNNKNEIAHSYENIGNLYKSKKEMSHALEFLEKALVIRKEIGNDQKLANTLNIIGNVYLQDYQYDKALEYYFNALEVRKSLKNKEKIAATYNNIGLIYKDIKNYEKASIYFEKALDLNKNNADKRDLAYSHSLIGGIRWEQEKFGEALSSYREAYRLRKSVGDKRLIAESLNNIGIIFKEIKEYVSAIEQYQQALEIYNEIGDKFGIAWTLNLFGNLYKEKGEFYTSLDYYKRSLQNYSEANHTFGIAQINKNIGESYLMLNQPNAAFSFLEKSVNLAQDLDEKELIKNSSLFFSEALAARGQHAKALKYYRLYSEAKDSIINIETLKRFADLQIKHEINIKQAEIDKINKEKQLISLKEQQRKSFLFIALCIILVLVIFFIILYRMRTRMYKASKESNKKLEEINNNLKRSEVELKASNKTKDKFLSIIAHDLKNPFGSFLSTTQLLVDNYDKFDNDKKKKFIDNIHFSATRTYDLLENLLQWSRSQMNGLKFNPKTINIQQTINEEIELHKVLATSNNIGIKNNIPKDLRIQADGNMIRTVFRNLLSNAIKYTEANTSIWFKYDENENDHIFTIKDEGKGLSEEDLKKLFRPEVAANIETSKPKGTGLGLILCKEFIDKHNGTIIAESQIDNGTAFIITLPK